MPTIRTTRTSSHRARRRAALTTLGLMLAACGGDDHSVSVTPDADAGVDAGQDADGGKAGTGGRAGSAARSGSGGTGGVAGDAGEEDAGPDPSTLDPTVRCQLAEENSTLELPVKFGTPSAFSIATGLTGFGLAYQSGGCGTVGTLPVASFGKFAEPMQLFGDDCARVDDMTLLRVSDGWRLAWIDNGSGSAELKTLLLSDSLGTQNGATRNQVTSDMLREHAPITASVGGVPFLAWISEDLNANQRQISRKRLDGDGNVATILPFDADRKPTSLAFAQMGRENAALAFVTEQGEAGVWLSKLDKDAQPSGDPIRLTEFVSAGNSVDLATREEDGGAVVYSVDVQGVNHDVRFRRLDKNGDLLGDEVKIVSSPVQARDASIARISGGYVVGYRQLPVTADEKAEVKIAFITKEGNVMRDSFGRLLTYPIADADPNGGRITLRVSVDGQLLVAYLNGTSGDNQLKLVRKRLDCTL